MDDSTIGTIYALKHADKEYDEAVTDYWSKYTGTPAKHYGEESLTKIAQSVFIDYIKTADNPSFEVWNLFDSIRFNYKLLHTPKESFDKRMRDAIWIALVRTTVRRNGNYVNGFRELND